MNTNIIRYRRSTTIHNPLADIGFAKLISVKTQIRTIRSRLKISCSRGYSVYYTLKVLANV